MLQKRREDARALRKLRETSTASPLDFARSALECDASSHRFYERGQYKWRTVQTT